MEERKKRKTTTSTAVKRRYNEKTYTLISVRVPKELAKAFMEKCARQKIAQAQVVKRAIRQFLDEN